MLNVDFDFAREQLLDNILLPVHAGMFGGNSNGRGLVWMPVNMLILRRC